MMGAMISAGLSWLISTLSKKLSTSLPNSEKLTTYECGFEPFGDARKLSVVSFYIVAMLFLLFDLEVVLLLPWGKGLSYVGFFVFMGISIYLTLLLIGYIYETDKGALGPNVANLLISAISFLVYVAKGNWVEVIDMFELTVIRVFETLSIWDLMYIKGLGGISWLFLLFFKLLKFAYIFVIKKALAEISKKLILEQENPIISIDFDLEKTLKVQEELDSGIGIGFREWLWAIILAFFSEVLYELLGFRPEEESDIFRRALNGGYAQFIPEQGGWKFQGYPWVVKVRDFENPVQCFHRFFKAAEQEDLLWWISEVKQD